MIIILIDINITIIIALGIPIIANTIIATVINIHNSVPVVFITIIAISFFLSLGFRV
jgi:hypothetical protein